MNKHLSEKEETQLFDYQNKDIKNRVEVLNKHFKRHEDMQHIDYLISNMNATIAYFDLNSIGKRYFPELKKIKSQYDHIKILIQGIKKQEDTQKHELDQILDKEIFIEKNTDEILNLYQAEEHRREVKKIFSVFGKTIGTMVLLCSLYEIGEFSYYHHEELGFYYEHRIKPKIIEFKEDALEKLVLIKEKF